jgi:hypothetical protein
MGGCDRQVAMGLVAEVLARTGRRLPASCSRRSTIGSTISPGGVSPVSLFPARTKISTPSSSSSSRIWRLIPGCDVCRTSATAVRLKPVRAASRTARSCWKFTVGGSEGAAVDVDRSMISDNTYAHNNARRLRLFANRI